MTAALARARALLDTPPPETIPGQLGLEHTMTYHPDMNAIELDEADGHPAQSDTASPCTCDDEGTLVTVDMGPEDGGAVDMCVGCYDAMRTEDGR